MKSQYLKDLQQSILKNAKLVEEKGDIKLYNSEILGQIYTKNTQILSFELDEPRLSQSLIHTAFCTHNDVQNVLLLGANEELIKQSKAHEFRNLDIIEPDLHEFLAKDLDVKKDAMSFLENTQDKFYDIIIINNLSLLNPLIFAQLKRVRKNNAIICARSDKFVFDYDGLKQDLEIFKDFKILLPFRIKSFFSMTNFIFASDKFHPTADLILQKADFLDEAMYYNSSTHLASFSLDKFELKTLKESIRL